VPPLRFEANTIVLPSRLISGLPVSRASSNAAIGVAEAKPLFTSGRVAA